MRRSSGWLLPIAFVALWLAGITIYLIQQETPTGWVKGKAVAEESGRPLPGVTVRLHLLSDAEGDDFVFRTRADGTFASQQIPAGYYQLQASSAAHSLTLRNFIVEEGKVQIANLELNPTGAFFSLRINQHVFTPEEKTEIIGRGFFAGEAIDFTLYRVDSSTLLRKYHGNLRNLLHRETSFAQLPIQDNPDLKEYQQFSASITRRDVEGIFRQPFELPIKEPGIYLVKAKAGTIQNIEWLMVTRLGLIVKQWKDQALAYVVDIKTGAPVAGAHTEFYTGKNKSISGMTDANGLFQAKLPLKKSDSSEDGEMLLTALVEKEGSQAFIDTSIWRREGDSQERIYAYTDRPVYRPGHKVFFKGIARQYADEGYSVLAGKQVNVKVMDSRDTLVYQANLTTNKYGSYAGSFPLNEEAATGYYSLISALAGEPQESGFKVAEYRKPEYTVEVTPEKKRYVKGEAIKAKVAAQYYFGAPVAGAEVTYMVRRTPYWAYFYGEESDYADEEEGGDGADYESEYEGDYGYGEVIVEGTARLEGDGTALLSIPTKASFQLKREQTAEDDSQDYQYTIEVTVTDASRKEVTGEGSTLVTQGEFAISVNPASYISTPDSPTRIEIEAKDYDGKPIRNTSVEVKAQQELWRGSSMNFEVEAQKTVTTDTNGKASFQFSPKTQGGYRIEAQAQDRFGNRVASTSHIWVASELYSDFGGVYPSLEIIANKKSYRIGETAILLINTKSKGATALVTVEGPRLYEHRLVALKGSSTRLELPIRATYAPNFFVAVAFVHNKEFASDEKRIKVSIERRKLQVQLRPDKERYTPGEKATYQIQTADWTGKPVPAELSLGVVDESIYAIQSEMAPPMVSFFYPPRENSVSTIYSFPQLYLDANKEAVNVKVRKKFPDTAFWNPIILTDAGGKASISFTMPDTLTTWRATARGTTLDTSVGEQVAKVKCSKDFLVRLEAPRFFTQKDRLTLAAVVHNYTSSEQAVDIWIKAPGLDIQGTGTVGKPEHFTLKPEGILRKEWQAYIPTPGDREITVYATAKSGLSDAVALTLPAFPHGRERVEWRSGTAEKEATERLPLRKDAVAGAGDLRIRITPSIASMLLGALDYLASYPYGCTEQTMSAFLPDVIVAKALRDLRVSNPKLEKKLPDMVQKGLFKLYGYQHEDGGWGWWEYDTSDLWMSAYVVFGLMTAKESGFSINETALARGTEWLLNEARKEPNRLTLEKLYVLHVLSLAGKDGFVDQQLLTFYNNRGTLDAYQLSLLVSTLYAKKRVNEARIAADRLWQMALENQVMLHWQGMGDWGKAGDTETTAMALKALFALNPSDARMGKIVRWLALNREGNRWVSTRDTAFALFALTDYLKHSQELQPDYQATVTLNGKQLLNRRFTRADIFAPEVEIRVPARSLKQGDNLLAIGKEGAGRLYYTAILTQFVSQGEIKSLVTGAGITVRREYYSMVSAKDPRTGIITTTPSPNPTTEFRSGESILVRLKIYSPKEYNYVVAEDPIPAGCEITERGGLEPWEWDRWWSDMDARDEKMAVFFRNLPAGNSIVEYHLRPQIPGDFHVMPTQVYSMYNPDLRGSGEETRIILR